MEKTPSFKSDETTPDEAGFKMRVPRLCNALQELYDLSKAKIRQMSNPDVGILSDMTGLMALRAIESESMVDNQK